MIDAAGVRAKFGVDPESIPDYLALVGDSADGFPGLAGWGAKSAAAVLGVYRHLEDIPPPGRRWDVVVRSAPSLSATLAGQMDLALLFRELATLVTEPPVLAAVDDLAWAGPGPGWPAMCAQLEAPELVGRAQRAARP